MLALLIALTLAWLIIKPFIAHIGLKETSSLKQFSRALSYDNNNPSHHYRIGLHRYYDPAGRDLNLALKSYLTAIGLSPANGVYWIGLSKALESTGNLKTSSSALDRAIRLNPSYAKPLWMKVNLLLSRGKTLEALHVLNHIIEVLPVERSRAFSVLHMTTHDDVELILEVGLPREQGAIEGYLKFLMLKKDTPGVTLVWKALSNGFEIRRPLALKYIDYLVSADEIREARRFLDSYEGRDAGTEELILNGGFETQICDNPFCWKTGRIEGALIRIDENEYYQGKRSLKIEFDGKSNVNFSQLFKVVPLEPGSPYVLSAHVKSEDITTTNGVFMELFGIGDCRFYSRSKAMAKTSDWTLLRIETTTPPECGGGRVRFRRLKSEKIDNLISGALWIDSVSLSKASTASEKAPDVPAVAGGGEGAGGAR